MQLTDFYILQHQSQVAAAVERAKTVTVAELNSILGVSVLIQCFVFVFIII